MKTWPIDEKDLKSIIKIRENHINEMLEQITVLKAKISILEKMNNTDKQKLLSNKSI